MKIGEVLSAIKRDRRIAGVLTKIRRPSQHKSVMFVIAFSLVFF